MDNDLISREALKKHILEIFEEEVKYDIAWAMGLKYSLKIIDLAPTVDVGIELAQEREKLYEESKKLYMLAKTLGKEVERPQGEWNYIQAGMCVCPFCGAMPHKLYKDYCAKCGAYLKGGDK